jgi:hypothetical protein
LTSFAVVKHLSFRWNDGLGTLNYQENGACSFKVSARHRKVKFLPQNSRLPIRRPGESRGPVTFAIFKSLGPGFRRDDEVSSITASVGDISPDSSGPSPE